MVFARTLYCTQKGLLRVHTSQSQADLMKSDQQHPGHLLQQKIIVRNGINPAHLLDPAVKQMAWVQTLPGSC